MREHVGGIDPVNNLFLWETGQEKSIRTMVSRIRDLQSRDIMERLLCIRPAGIEGNDIVNGSLLKWVYSKLFMSSVYVFTSTSKTISY